jgi:hypothetical protein
VTRALIPEFNRVILELAPRHEARAFAPSTLAELRACAAERTSAGLIVWSGESARTIYADARVNFAFRAWHDAEHVRGGHAFDLTGERATADAQARAVLAAYPSAPRAWLALLDAEVNGQAEHFARFGEFPVNQVAFVRDALERLT